MYNEKKKLWSQTFQSYYVSEIHAHIGTKLGRVFLERLGCYNLKLGTTQNMFQRVLNEWKESPVEISIFMLHQLQGFYLNQIRMGFFDCGDLHLLHDQVPDAAMNAEDVKLQASLALAESVDEMKQRLSVYQKPVDFNYVVDESDAIHAQSIIDANDSVQFSDIKHLITCCVDKCLQDSMRCDTRKEEMKG